MLLLLKRESFGISFVSSSDWTQEALALELLLTPVGELVREQAAGETKACRVLCRRVCVHVAVAADWTDKLKLRTAALRFESWY